MGVYPDDTFLTIAEPAEGFYKEKGSKFLAFAFPVVSEEEVKKHVEALKKKYYDARHHCYAYVLGKDKTLFRANDDGEPSSTAGKPILGQIHSFDLTNILIVVVRYFGGKKLGASGLIVAYRIAAADALEHAKIFPYVITQKLEVHCSYAEVEQVMRLMKTEELNMLNQEYTATEAVITLSVRETLLERVIKQLDFAAVVKFIS